MKIFNEVSSVDFLGKRGIAAVISALLIGVGIFSLFTKGLNLSIDFTGGSVIEVSYKNTADLSVIRSTLAENGFSKAVVQNFGTDSDVMIRVPLSNQEDNIASNSETSINVVELLKRSVRSLQRMLV